MFDYWNNISNMGRRGGVYIRDALVLETNNPSSHNKMINKCPASNINLKNLNFGVAYL